jgi:hypothetical protein
VILLTVSYILSNHGNLFLFLFYFEKDNLVLSGWAGRESSVNSEICVRKVVLLRFISTPKKFCELYLKH